MPLTQKSQFLLVSFSVSLALCLTAGATLPRAARVNDPAVVKHDSTHLDATKNVEIRFKDAAHQEIPDFQKHVAPLLGRLGCNGRACHGSFQGQGGFQLSLFGYDFKTDHEALFEKGTGRVDLESPTESLILTKPISEDDHEGGMRYEKDGWEYNLLSAWIESGGKSPDSLHKLSRLVVEPSELLLKDPAQQAELKAFAHWADGTVEDVTPLCRFHSNDDSIAKISSTGFVSTDTISGDTHVVVSYDNAVVPVPVIHPISGLSANPKTLRNPSRIDQLVAQKWDKLGLQPSERSDDVMFLRRVSIDITGTLPSPEEIREFASSQAPNKRSQKVDELLDSPSYAAWWTTFFCDMTENNTEQLRNISYDNNSASQQWYDWIYERVEQNTPYDQMVSGIVLGVSRKPNESYTDYCERMTALNQTSEFAQSDSMPYYWMRREFKDADARAISFAHAFLGLRIQCAQCHKHPFDQWSQADFKEFSKFFGGVTSQQYNQGKTPEDRKEYAQILKDLQIDPKSKNNGDVRRKLTKALNDGKTTPFGFVTIHQPRPSREELQAFSKLVKEAKKKDRKAIIPRPQITHARLLGGDTIELKKHDDVRVPVMDWMRSPDNPFFAKAIANRVWASYFGVGIVDPADDLNLANPPSNAALLDYLANSFIEHDFDMKWLHREIANSQTYQLSWVPNETNGNDRRNFSRALPRRLAAEVVFDAISSSVSNSKTNQAFRDNIDNRAISIPGTATRYSGKKKSSTDSAFALKVFGRSERASSCDCDRSAETSLIQTVYMQNDRDIHTMLTHKNSWVNQMALKHETDPALASYQSQITSQQKRIQAAEKSRLKFAKSKNTKQLKRIDKQITGMKKKLAPIQAKLEAALANKTKMDINEVVTEAYLRTLSRFPSEQELERCKAYIQNDDDLINGVTGVLWALVNTKEFIVNH
ncbi:MAG: hypothetical protein ACI814_002094 [Mariniblastus sp.]